MTYIPSPPISKKIGNNNIRKHPRAFMPRIKTVKIEAVVKEERIALDNKFRASFFNSLCGTKMPNYSKQEVIDILEKER